MTFQKNQRLGTERARKESQSNNSKILKYYDKAEKEIRRKLRILYREELKEVDPDKYMSVLRQKRILDSLLEDVVAIQYFYNDIINRELETGVRQSFINNYYYQSYMANWVNPSYQVPIIDFIAVEVAIYHTTAKWNSIADKKRKRLMEGLAKATKNRNSLTNTLLNKKYKDANRIKEAIVNGLILGQSNRQIASEISRVSGINKRSAMRISRTETNSNLNASEYWHTMNSRNYGVDGRRQIVSVLDTRTRRQSQIVDKNLEVLPEGYFRYPGGKPVIYPGSSGVPSWDINDRETTITIYEGLEPKARRAKNPYNGKYEIIGFDSFDDWMKMHKLTRLKNGEIVPIDPNLRKKQTSTRRTK